MTRDPAGSTRQRAIRATDSDWERVARRASAAGLSISDFVIERVLASPGTPSSSEALPGAVRMRLAQATLVLFASEARRMHAAGKGAEWETMQEEVGRWLESQEGIG